MSSAPVGIGVISRDCWKASLVREFAVNETTCVIGVANVSATYLAERARFDPEGVATRDVGSDGQCSPIVVRHRASIGSNSTIVAGITIGKGVLVGASETQGE